MASRMGKTKIRHKAKTFLEDKERLPHLVITFIARTVNIHVRKQDGVRSI